MVHEKLWSWSSSIIGSLPIREGDCQTVKILVVVFRYRGGQNHRIRTRLPIVARSLGICTLRDNKRNGEKNAFQSEGFAKVSDGSWSVGGGELAKVSR